MKKKIIIIIVAVVLVAIAVCAILLNRPPKESAAAVAVVLSVHDGINGWQSAFLFNALDSSHDGSDLFSAGLNSGVEFTDKDGNSISAADIEPGQLVEVTYSGYVQTIYPPNYMDVLVVKVLGQAASDLYALALKRSTEYESQSFPRIMDITTYSEYEGGPVGCEYLVIDTGSASDSDMADFVSDYSYLPSSIMGDDNAPMARIRLTDEYGAENISVRTHAPNMPDTAFDVVLEAEKQDDNSYVISLPKESGKYCIAADVEWADGVQKTIGFISIVR